MSNRILVCSAEGIGNCIQLSPCLRTLKEVLGYELDYWHAFSSFKIPKIIPYVDKWFSGGEITNIKPKEYLGLVSTVWTKALIKKIALKNLTKITPLDMNRAEVDAYMDIARWLGVEEDKIIWHGTCLYNKNVKEMFDVVIHDGYNSYGKANWSVKSYPHYGELVKKLLASGLSVCSVGSKCEYIKGTINKTGLDLLDTLGIIANSSLFVGNDSGLYHCANALATDNVVIFTATSITKNYCDKFHKYSTVLGRHDLECRKTCQQSRVWNKGCSEWKCRDLSVDIVYDAVMKYFYDNKPKKLIKVESNDMVTEPTCLGEHDELLKSLDRTNRFRKFINKVFK